MQLGSASSLLMQSIPTSSRKAIPSNCITSTRSQCLLSRTGDCVLHPFLGPRFKAAVVTTDLPLLVDKPIDFGLQDFCSRCKKCARECPSGALSSGDKVIYNGYERWPSHTEKCTSMRVGNQKGSGCGTCIKVCPE